jgi:hypothetical protein
VHDAGNLTQNTLQMPLSLRSILNAKPFVYDHLRCTLVKIQRIGCWVRTFVA